MKYDARININIDEEIISILKKMIVGKRTKKSIPSGFNLFKFQREYLPTLYPAKFITSKIKDLARKYPDLKFNSLREMGLLIIYLVKIGCL